MGEDAVHARARAIALDYLEALDGAAGGAAIRYRYLVAMAAEGAGLLRRLATVERGGGRVVVLVGPPSGARYEVADPGLGPAEGALVRGAEWVLFGGACPLRAPHPRPVPGRAAGGAAAGWPRGN